jgi:hypothetical protein
VDADRFDTLARALQTSPTRRLALSALTALGLAAVLGDNESEAGKRGGGKKKGGGKKGGKKKKRKNRPPDDSLTCGVDSDCNGVADGPYCCNNGAFSGTGQDQTLRCAKCCMLGNRGCAADQICSTETIDGPVHCF